MQGQKRRKTDRLNIIFRKKIQKQAKKDQNFNLCIKFTL